MLYSVFLGLHTWCWILTLLALAKKFLSGTNRFLKYASGASYPFYILHFVLMLIIGYYVMQSNLGLAGTGSRVRNPERSDLCRNTRKL